MRRPAICVNEIENMTTSGKNLEVCSESRIERMRKLLSSPLTRRKSPTRAKVFGTPLEVLIQTINHGAPVPFVVTRICRYIEEYGMTQEGLFRISGNARLIERLKTSFDQSGDAPLETEGDVPSAAGLLKLFLRELPDPVIPSSMHPSFLSAIRDHRQDKGVCIRRLRGLVNSLPEENFCLLKYLSHFLADVAQHEEHNRMGTSALGIVFGPNLFRVAEDYQGLRDQAVTNQIVSCFISAYDSIFEMDENMPLVKDPIPPVVESSFTASDAGSNLVHIMPKKVPLSPVQSVSLEPLSVEIPSFEENLLSLPPEIQQTTSDAKQVPVLLLDSAGDVGELMYDECNPGQKIEVALIVRRKRKERRPSGDDGQPMRSSSEERPLPNHTSLSLLSEGDQMRRCNSHDEVRSVPMESSADGSNDDTKEEDCADNEGGVSSSLYDRPSFYAAKVLERSDAADLSPHPPEPKRREIDNSFRDRLLDDQKTSPEHISDVEQHTSTYEAAFHGEPSLMLYRAFPPRSRRMASRGSWRKMTAFDCQELQHRAKTNPMEEDDNDVSCLVVPPSPPDSNPADDIEIGDNDSLKENEDKVAAPRERDSDSGSICDVKTTSFKDSADVRTDNVAAHEVSAPHHIHHHRHYQQPISEEDRLSHPLLELHPFPSNHEDREGIQAPTTQQEQPANGYSKDSIPPLDLNTLHQHGDGSEPIPSEHRFSWPMIKVAKEDEASHSSQQVYLRKASSYEAPLSPSAYRSYLSTRSLILDASMPPSPPVEQENYPKGSVKDDAMPSSIKHLTKKIHSLKKKIKQFEENFEADHGYRPSHAEKMSHSPSKKLMTELSKARKELKQLKEEAQNMDNCSPSASWVSRVSEHSPVAWKSPKKLGLRADQDAQSATASTATMAATEEEAEEPKPSMEEVLRGTLKTLMEFRKSGDRPEELEKMTTEQVLDEKLAMQKALLRFESIHGRPSTKEVRDLMRPLYDRYRNVKRLLSRYSSYGSLSVKGKEPSMELQPILEHVAMDFSSTTPTYRSSSMEEDEQYTEREGTVPTGSSLIDEEERTDNSEQLDQPSVSSTTMMDTRCDSPESKRNGETYNNLHELPLSDLQKLQHQTRIEKRKLRRVLREFEDDFQKKTGRRVQKEDRMPMEAVYYEYKHMKAKLRLLEALVAKHEQNNL